MAERRRLAERIRGIRNERDGRKVEKTKKKRKKRERCTVAATDSFKDPIFTRRRIRKRRGEKRKEPGVGK